MKLTFYCREEYCPMHYYEAMQVFAHLKGMPEIIPGSDPDCFVSGTGHADSLLTVEYDDGRVENLPVFLKDAVEKACEDDKVLAANRSLSNDKNILKRHLYFILSEIYGYKSPWGALTGVRPVKVLHKLLQAGLSEKEAEAHFRDFFFVTDKKISLCFNTLKNQLKFLESPEEEISFYVSVPFCPTICSYCTFGSSPVARYSSRIDAYIDELVKETEFAARGIGGRVSEIYVGGGTPTSISPEQLDRLLSALAGSFDIGNLSEFSVEAGRPDTVTQKKLETLKKHGVTRISINPQSMNDPTLEAVGRRHTSAQTVEAFRLARSIGFDNINMDVIAGLPGETAEDFKRTMDAIGELGPDGLTVHTLALKRASRLSKDDCMKKTLAVNETAVMCDIGAEAAVSMGMRPYYLYRQKNCIGNNENVSYCRPGFESPYNVHIMEEDRTVIACGAGAVTKIVKDGGREISRFFNTKSVNEYLMIPDEIMRRKEAALSELSG